MRTLAALLALRSFSLTWPALVLVGAAVFDWMGITDEAAVGLVLFAAPVLAYFSAVTCGIFLITPQQSQFRG